MSSATFRCAAASLLLPFLQPAAAFADPTFVVGARVSCDVPTSSGDAYTDSCPGVEISGRFVLSPTVSLDGSIGYRRSSYSYRGPSFYSWSLTQYPLLVGASYAPFPRASVRPLASAGVLLAPYRATYSQGSTAHSSTALSIGAFVGIGVEVSLSRPLRLDAGFRYVVCPINADSRVHARERYPVALLGLSRVF